MTEPTWTTTRSQLIDALANIEIRGVKASGPLAGKVIADDVADAILEQLPQAGHVFTEYATAYGGGDPNDAHILAYDDEAEAAEHVQWIAGAYVARRTVTRSRWERVAETSADPAAGDGKRSEAQAVSGALSLAKDQP
jgi:hypothetical protein